MRKNIAKALCAVLAPVLLTSCAPLGAGIQYGGLTGTVTVGGACASEWSMSIILEAFTFNNNTTTVSYTPSSSLFGISGVYYGTLDFGVTCYPFDMPDTVQATPFAQEAIAVLVSAENPVEGLTLAQLRGIYVGDITNWREVGGDDAPIVVYGRRQNSGTRHAFEKAIDALGECDYDVLFSGNGGIAAEVGRNKYAIGYTSNVPYYSPVTYLAIEGVEPSRDALLEGTYPLYHTFYFLQNTEKPLDETGQAFLEFFWNADLEELVSATGIILQR